MDADRKKYILDRLDREPSPLPLYATANHNSPSYDYDVWVALAKVCGAAMFNIESVDGRNIVAKVRDAAGCRIGAYVERPVDIIGIPQAYALTMLCKGVVADDIYPDVVVLHREAQSKYALLHDCMYRAVKDGFAGKDVNVHWYDYPGFGISQHGLHPKQAIPNGVKTDAASYNLYYNSVAEHSVVMDRNEAIRFTDGHGRPPGYPWISMLDTYGTKPLPEVWGWSTNNFRSSINQAALGWLLAVRRGSHRLGGAFLYPGHFDIRKGMTQPQAEDRLETWVDNLCVLLDGMKEGMK